jgi:hypothetical protein
MVSALYDKFMRAANEAAIDLGLNPKKIKFRPPLETPHVGIDYDAILKNDDGKGFTFHIRTSTEHNDPTSGLMGYINGYLFCQRH